MLLAQVGRSDAVVLAVFAFILPIVLFGMWMGWQEMKQKQQTVREAVRLAVEKGGPLPEGLLAPAAMSLQLLTQRRKDRGHYELTAGLILLAVAGGMVFLAKVVSPLLALLGAALLVVAWVDLRPRQGG